MKFISRQPHHRKSHRIAYETRNGSYNRQFPAVLIPLTRGATGIKGEELPFGWSVNEICFWDQRGAFNGTSALGWITRPNTASTDSINSVQPVSVIISLHLCGRYHAISVCFFYTRARSYTYTIIVFDDRTRRMFVRSCLSHACTILFLLYAFYADVYTAGHKFFIICFYRMFSDAPDESVILRVAFVSCEYGEQGNVDKYVNREQFTDEYSVIEYFRVTKYIVVGIRIIWRSN